MLNVLKKIFGDKHEKNLKLLWPVVDEINQEYEKLKQLSDDELRAKTQEFKDKISEFTAETRKQIDELKGKLQGDEDFDRNAAYDELDASEEKLNDEYEEILSQILPEAFAVVKSTCERLVGNNLDSRRKEDSLRYGSLRCSAYWWCCYASGKNCRDGNR